MRIMSLVRFQKFLRLNGLEVQHRRWAEQLIYHERQIENVAGQVDWLKVQIKISTRTWGDGYPFRTFLFVERINRTRIIRFIRWNSIIFEFDRLLSLRFLRKYQFFRPRFTYLFHHRDFLLHYSGYPLNCLKISANLPNSLPEIFLTSTRK